MSVTLLIGETKGGTVDGGGCGGGGVEATGGAICNSLVKAGLSRNRRCSAPGRREDSVLGLTDAEACGAADRPIGILGDGLMSPAGMLPIGAGWMIEEIGASRGGETDGRSAPVGVSGGEGEVGFLINE